MQTIAECKGHSVQSEFGETLRFQSAVKAEGSVHSDFKVNAPLE